MNADPAIVELAGIDIQITPYAWDFAHDQAARIDNHWAARREETPALFDGRVLIARQLARVGDRLAGTCFEASYRSFLAWRDFGFPGAPVVNAFAMPALCSADGAFLLGEMSATTANAGQLYFPAGTPEPADAGPGGRVDFDANILRELVEETGLTAVDVSLGVNWTAVFAGPLAAFIKVAQSPLDAMALQERFAAFNATIAAPELTRLVPVRGVADYDTTRMPAFMLRYLDHMLAG